MQNDMLAKAQARVADAQKQLDDALLAGLATTQAREYLDTARAELTRLEAAESGKNETASANNQRDLQTRVDGLVGKARTELEAEVRDLGFNDVPPFEIGTGAATAYLQAGDRAHAELLAEAADRKFRAGIQAQIADNADQRQALIQRRLAGHQSPDDAANLALLDADMGGLRDLLARREMPKATQAALWRDQAKVEWDATIGRVRDQILFALAEDLGERVFRVAKAQSTAKFGVSPRRFSPSMALRKAIEGRVY